MLQKVILSLHQSQTTSFIISKVQSVQGSMSVSDFDQLARHSVVNATTERYPEVIQEEEPRTMETVSTVDDQGSRPSVNSVNTVPTTTTEKPPLLQGELIS